jgi:hypothetical protein
MHYVETVKVYAPERVPLSGGGHFFQHKIVIKGRDLVTIIMNSNSDLVTQIITPQKPEIEKKDDKKSKSEK